MLTSLSSTSKRLTLTLGVALAACSHADGNRSPASGVTAEPIGEIDERFVADVKDAFAAYRIWGRVDDEMRWAPFLCRMPQPGRPAMSGAADGAHARRLYSLFAKEHTAYAALGNANAPVGGNAQAGAQIVAKESFLPEVVADAPKAPLPSGSDPPEADHFHPYTTGEDGKTIPRVAARRRLLRDREVGTHVGHRRGVRLRHRHRDRRGHVRGPRLVVHRDAMRRRSAAGCSGLCVRRSNADLLVPGGVPSTMSRPRLFIA